MIEPPQPLDILTIHGYSLTSVSTPLIIFVSLLASPQLHMELVEDAATVHLKPRFNGFLAEGFGQKTIFIVDSLENADDDTS